MTQVYYRTPAFGWIVGNSENAREKALWDMTPDMSRPRQLDERHPTRRRGVEGTRSPFFLRRLFLRVGHVLFVGALEVFDVAVVEVPDAGGDFVDQIVIVGHQEHRARVLLQREVEGVDGLQIEVIGG